MNPSALVNPDFVLACDALDERELASEVHAVLRSARDQSHRLRVWGRRAHDVRTRRIAGRTARTLSACAAELERLLAASFAHGAHSRTRAAAIANPTAGQAPRPPTTGATSTDTLEECEHAVAHVAVRYRDLIERPLSDRARRVLMQQFGRVIASYERVRSQRDDDRARGVLRTGQCRDERGQDRGRDVHRRTPRRGPEGPPRSLRSLSLQGARASHGPARRKA